MVFHPKMLSALTNTPFHEVHNQGLPGLEMKLPFSGGPHLRLNAGCSRMPQNSTLSAVFSGIGAWQSVPTTKADELAGYYLLYSM